MKIVSTKIEEVSRSALLSRLQENGMSADITEIDMSADTFDRGKLKRALDGGSFLFAIIQEDVYVKGLESGDSELEKVLEMPNVHCYTKHMGFIEFLDEQLGTDDIPSSVDLSGFDDSDFTFGGTDETSAVSDKENDMNFDFDEFDNNITDEFDTFGTEEFSGTVQEDVASEVEAQSDDFGSFGFDTDISFEDFGTDDFGSFEADFNNEETEENISDNTELTNDITEMSSTGNFNDFGDFEETADSADFGEFDDFESTMDMSDDFENTTDSDDWFNDSTGNLDSVENTADSDDWFNDSTDNFDGTENIAENEINENIMEEQGSFETVSPSEEENTSVEISVEAEIDFENSADMSEPLGEDIEEQVNEFTGFKREIEPVEVEADMEVSLDKEDTNDFDLFVNPEDYVDNIPSVEDILSIPTSEINLLNGVDTENCDMLQKVVNNAEFVIKNLSGHIKYLKSNVDAIADKAEVSTDYIIEMQTKNDELEMAVVNEIENVNSLRVQFAEEKLNVYNEMKAEIDALKQGKVELSEDVRKELDRKTEQLENTLKENEELRKNWEDYKQEYKASYDMLKQKCSDLQDNVKKLTDENEILLNDTRRNEQRVQELEALSSQKDLELKEIKDDLFYNIGVGTELDSAVQKVLNVPTVPITNVKALFAGSSNAVYESYKFLYNSLSRYGSESYIILDFTSETYIDAVFGYRSTVSAKDWVMGDADLDSVLADTKLPYVKCASLGFHPFNANALLKLDWYSLFMQLSRRTETVIIMLGYMNTFANNLLYNSFKMCCTSYVYLDSTPASLRNFFLYISRFNDINRANTKIIHTVKAKKKAIDNFIKRLSDKGAEIRQLSSEEDTIKL